MAQVTSPILLDSTGQGILSVLQDFRDNEMKVTMSTEDLEDGVSALPSGELYLVYSNDTVAS